MDEKELKWLFNTLNGNARVALFFKACEMESFTQKDIAKELLKEDVYLSQSHMINLLKYLTECELLSKTKMGRDINRQYFNLDEIRKEVKRKIVRKIFELCKIRNYNKCFNGEFKLLKTKENIIEIEWKYKKDQLKLIVNLKTYKTEIFLNNKLILKQIQNKPEKY